MVLASQLIGNDAISSTLLSALSVACFPMLAGLALIHVSLPAQRKADRLDCGKRGKLTDHSAISPFAVMGCFCCAGVLLESPVDEPDHRFAGCKPPCPASWSELLYTTFAGT